MQSLSPRTFLVTFSFDARVIGMLTAQEVLLPTNYFIKTTLLKQWGMTGTGECPPTVRILLLFTQELVMPIKILTRWNSPIRIPPSWFMQIQSRSECEIFRNIKGTPTILLVALCIEILVRTARSGQGTGSSSLLSSHTVSALSPRIKIVC